MDAQLMAIMVEGNKKRIYLSPNEKNENIAASAKPKWKPEAELPYNTRDFKTPNYGMQTFGELFTPRQLVALNAFCDLVDDVREKIKIDTPSIGKESSNLSVNEDGVEITAYADAIATYL